VRYIPPQLKDRDSWCEREMSRDPIFLFQRRAIEATEECSHDDDERDGDCETCHRFWLTDSVWLDRESAEAWGESVAHRYPDGWRVYSVCAEGDLALLLRGAAAEAGAKQIVQSPPNGRYEWTLDMRTALVAHG